MSRRFDEDSYISYGSDGLPVLKNPHKEQMARKGFDVSQTPSVNTNPAGKAKSRYQRTLAKIQRMGYSPSGRQAAQRRQTPAQEATAEPPSSPESMSGAGLSDRRWFAEADQGIVASAGGRVNRGLFLNEPDTGISPPGVQGAPGIPDTDEEDDSRVSPPF